MEQPNFYAILPANIRYSKELSMFQKLLYAEITALTQKDGYCWASNKYFAELYDMTDTHISLSIKKLKELGFLEVFIEKEKGNLRKIYIGETRRASGKVGVKEVFNKSLIPIEENLNSSLKKVKDPYLKKVKENNINNNIINNNKSNIIINNTENKFSENSEKEKIENFSDYEILENKNFQENTELTKQESLKSSAADFEKSVEIVKKEITENIDNLIIELKNLCNEVGVAYDGSQERNFARHILTTKEFGRFCENINQTRLEFAKNILKASIQINFWKICSGPKLIYKNYAEVYNKAFLLKNNGKLGQVRQQSKIITI